uniref:Mitochondrial splicing suppressor 51-like C-terminal domain-containing protein n=1 Tax=Bracon brevicornis TaxID=1563983 RepID=A0A6V7IAR7_9HYME
MEWNSFYSNACYECGNWGEGYPLMYCKKCRAVSFCEKDSRALNTKHHDLCQVLSELRKEAPSVLQMSNRQEVTQQAWTAMKSNIMLLVQLSLGRKLTKQEEEVLKFPKKCVSCYENDPEKLIDCKVCPGTSFCARHLQTKEEHADRCRKLTECAASDVFYSPMLKTAIPSIPEDQSNVKLPEDMAQFIKICGPNFVPFPHNVQTSASSEVFTRPLSLLYAMEKLNLEIKERLIVHVIGANIADLEDPSTFEIILHFKQNLKELILIFIGPDLSGLEIPDFSKYLCRECKKEKMILHVKIFPSFYHDFMKNEEFSLPDLVIGYNIGVHECFEFASEGDTWYPSIAALGNLDCPLIVTTYTKDEAEKDYERILKSSKRFTCLLQEKNPFASLRHYRDFENDDFYYQNQFIMIFGREGQNEEVLKQMKELKLNDNAMVCE